MLYGPSSLNGKIDKKSNGVKWGIREVNPYMVACASIFVCEYLLHIKPIILTKTKQAQFLPSEDVSLDPKGKTTGIAYAEGYKEICRLIILQSGNPTMTATLQWLGERVFQGVSLPSVQAKDLGPSEEVGEIDAAMKAFDMDSDISDFELGPSAPPERAISNSGLRRAPLKKSARVSVSDSESDEVPFQQVQAHNIDNEEDGTGGMEAVEDQYEDEEIEEEEKEEEEEEEEDKEDKEEPFRSQKSRRIVPDDYSNGSDLSESESEEEPALRVRVSASVTLKGGAAPQSRQGVRLEAEAGVCVAQLNGRIPAAKCVRASRPPPAAATPQIARKSAGQKAPDPVPSAPPTAAVIPTLRRVTTRVPSNKAISSKPTAAASTRPVKATSNSQEAPAGPSAEAVASRHSSKAKAKIPENKSKAKAKKPEATAEIQSSLIQRPRRGRSESSAH